MQRIIAALMCLEGNFACVPAGISVCDMYWENAGYMAAHALLRDQPVLRTSRGYLRLQALLMERVTTP